MRNAAAQSSSQAEPGHESSTRLIPVTRWPDHHPWPSVAGLRWLVFNSRSSGFDEVVRRVGRRVLIDERAFFQWVEQENAPAARVVVHR